MSCYSFHEGRASLQGIHLRSGLHCFSPVSRSPMHRIAVPMDPRSQQSRALVAQAFEVNFC
ncbi:MAG: hypothetical protein ACI9K5_002125 [Gammaproteobacteria bacterium]|jgi:hypothetical protein